MERSGGEMIIIMEEEETAEQMHADFGQADARWVSHTRAPYWDARGLGVLHEGQPH